MTPAEGHEAVNSMPFITRIDDRPPLQQLQQQLYMLAVARRWRAASPVSFSKKRGFGVGLREKFQVFTKFLIFLLILLSHLQ